MPTAIGNLIENWHLSDFHISRARPEQESGYAEHLSREGENLALVVEFLQKQHPKVFNDILQRLAARVPGITRVDAKTTEESRVLLRFQDGAFEDPFLARYVSDGTIKMLAYLVLLFDPRPHPLLCGEEPENQLYPSAKVLLEGLLPRLVPPEVTVRYCKRSPKLSSSQSSSSLAQPANSPAP